MVEDGSHPLDQHAEEGVPLDAPPPYDSLVFADKAEMKSPTDSIIFRDSPPPGTESSRPRSLATPPAPVPPSTFKIAVVDPVRQGEGVGAYVSYKIVSTVDFDGYRPDQHEVIRRFRDFTWLKNRLRSQYRGAILPALPEKNVVEKYKMGGEFIEQRRAALEVFLRRVAAHPLLHNSPDLRLFLQSDETEFAIESSRMAAEAGDAAPAATSGAASAARKTFNGAARLFKSLSQSAAGLTNVGGSSSSTSTHITYPREEEESVEYLKARAYFSDLENHLAEVHKQAERLVRHHGALAAALSEFSGAMAALGRHQEEEVGRQAGTPVVRSFVTLSDRAAAVAGVSKRSSEELAASFEAPMKEFMRSVRAAKKAMADRSEALAARQAARADVDAKRARLTRLRATPGLVEERVMEAERDLQTAMKTADDATKAYSNIVQRMDSDIIRFQQERVEEMKKVLTLFSQVEAKAAADSAKLWDTLGAGAMAGEESAAA